MAVGGILTIVGLLLWLRREQSVVSQARDRAVVSRPTLPAGRRLRAACTTTSRS